MVPRPSSKLWKCPFRGFLFFGKLLANLAAVTLYLYFSPIETLRSSSGRESTKLSSPNAMRRKVAQGV
jgi:hypothetical protein